MLGAGTVCSMRFCTGNLDASMKHKCDSEVVAGIDVGGKAKGFHAVALAHGKYFAQMSSCDPGEVAAWCNRVGARAVGIDAPIDWSKSGGARCAERELAASKIRCFSTPSERAAKSHPGDYFGWMLNGAALYKRIENHYRRFDGAGSARLPVCFETFPHAVACALAGKVISARNKAVVRRALLSDAGVDTDSLRSIDAVDAALCALAAVYFFRNEYETYGDRVEGFIVVPARIETTGERSARNRVFPF
jgi:predicted nuclease with RNAse H fold